MSVLFSLLMFRGVDACSKTWPKGGNVKRFEFALVAFESVCLWTRFGDSGCRWMFFTLAISLPGLGDALRLEEEEDEAVRVVREAFVRRACVGTTFSGDGFRLLPRAKVAGRRGCAVSVTEVFGFFKTDSPGWGSWERAERLRLTGEKRSSP